MQIHDEDRQTRLAARAAVLSFVALGAYLRLRGLGSVLLYGDEYHTVPAAALSYGTILASFDAVGSHALLPLLQRFCVSLFGESLWTLRLPALIPGILAPLGAYVLARRFFERVPSAIAAMALSVSSIHVFYSRFARVYALVGLLGLLCAVASVRWARDAQRARGRRFLGLGALLLAALIPWGHLSASGFALALGVASCSERAARAGSMRGAAAPAALFGLAGLLCAALYWPAREQLLAFLDKVQGEGGSFGLLEVPSLLFGGPLAALLAVLALLPAAILLALRMRSAARWLLPLLLGPLILLLAARPYGMAYAYARYLLVALPIALMLLAWLYWVVLRALLRSPSRADLIALSTAAVALLAWAWYGPLRSADVEGPFGNSYLSLMPLPAFDEPAADMPPFYRELAADPRARTIVEAPALFSRSVLLYRNYQLLHGKEVALGVPEESSGTGSERFLPPEGYAVLGRDELSGRGDYLILHKNAAAEVARYWQFVYQQAWPRARRLADAGLMENHRDLVFAPPGPDPALAARMRIDLGPPSYEDDDLLVWRLRAAP
jgi:hypothetical protein